MHKITVFKFGLVCTGDSNLKIETSHLVQRQVMAMGHLNSMLVVCAVTD